MYVVIATSELAESNGGGGVCDGDGDNDLLKVF